MTFSLQLHTCSNVPNYTDNLITALETYLPTNKSLRIRKALNKKSKSFYKAIKVKSQLHIEVCYLKTGITMHIHFVSFYMNDISECFMMLNNTQLHNLMSNREKLCKEVKRKDREASDFQAKVSEMKRQQSIIQGNCPRWQGLPRKTSGEQRTKGADSLPGWLKPRAF